MCNLKPNLIILVVGIIIPFVNLLYLRLLLVSQGIFGPVSPVKLGLLLPTLGPKTPQAPHALL